MNYQVIRITDSELLKIFPEAKEIIPEKIKERETQRDIITLIIKDRLALIKYTITDEFSQWFWREWLKVNEGQKILEVDKQIARLRRLLFISKGRKTRGGVTQEKIDQALTVPIIEVAKSQLERLTNCGSRAVALCPFHKEKTPSFTIYKDTNSFFCFGCQQGGNVINFIMSLHGFSFPEAVKWLIGE